MHKVRLISSSPEACWLERPAPAGGGAVHLTVSESQFQRIEGFGGCFNELGWIALSQLDEAMRKQALDALFDPVSGCRFSLCRLPIGASDYAEDWYSLAEADEDYALNSFSIDRDRRHLLPYLREALVRRPDMRLFASPWSPPVWMKHPRAYNYGVLRWEKRVLETYARYFVKYIRAYEALGIRIEQIHPQNEPASDQKFPSCRWTGEQLREFIAAYLGPLFETEGINTQIWLGTINAPEADDYLHTDYDAFAGTVLGDERARRYIAGVGYQWGGKHAIQRTHEAWPDLPLLQTENECGDGKNTWEYAAYVFSLMKHYFSNGASGYVYWNMALLPRGRSTWGWEQNTMITADPVQNRIVFNPEYYLMKHFSHCIDNGAIRLGTSGPLSANALAFRNPNGSTAVVLCNSLETERQVTVAGCDGVWDIPMPPCSFHTLMIPAGKQ